MPNPLRPSGRLTPYDPGVFSDEAGGYWSGNPIKNGQYDPSGLTYGGTDPSVYHIGQDASTASGQSPHAGAPLPISSGPNPVAALPSGPLPAPTPPMNPVPQSNGGPSPSPTDLSTAMRAILVNQMQGASTATSLDSPEIQPALSAYNLQSQRDQQAQRDQLAEDAYARGGGDLSVMGTGGFNTAAQQSAEAAAAARANFAGSLVAQVAQQKRQQLVQMLNTASQYGLTDQAQKIQAQIATIDAQLRQQGITNQLAEFGTTAGLTQQQITNQMRQFGIQAGMTQQQMANQVREFGIQAGMTEQQIQNQIAEFERSAALQQQQITNQNVQAGNVLGFNYAQLLAQMNRDALLNGLQ